MSISRRRFLERGAQAGLLGSIGGLGALNAYAPQSVAETTVTPEMVRFTDDIEPYVQLIEKTPRDKCVEVMAREMRRGMTYQQFLSALFLAGIRNVSPQPPGFKFHCVFIIHSANYLSLMSPPEERVLPVFWSLDDFKKAQEQDVREGDFVLRTAPGTLPSGETAWAEFHGAMGDWDEERALRSVTALAREKTPEEVFEGLWQYGARDYRNIGHKIIFVAHAWRTLETIGWQYAEPALLSLVLGLLDFGKLTRLNGYGFSDQCYADNAEAVRKYVDGLPGGWTGGTGDEAFVNELLEPLRRGDMKAACDLTLTRVRTEGAGAQAVWDAAHVFAGELMMRQTGIGALHSVTSLNSMHYAFRTAKADSTKLLMLLQAVGWMSQFRNFLDLSKDDDLLITDLAEVDFANSEEKAVESIASAISSDRDRAAREAFTFGKRFERPDAYFDVGRRLVFLKANEHHQLKWPAAIFEDYHHVSPEWRPHMLAASTYYLRGTEHSDSEVTARAIRELGTG